MDLPIWKVQRALPTDIDENFKTTEPIPGHPLYRGRNPPPGFFVHPKSNTFVPACQQCLLKGERTPDGKRVSCTCQEPITRPYVMPTTTLSNLYPLTYQVYGDRATHHNTYEPLLGDEIFINIQCDLAYKHFNLGLHIEQLTTDQTKVMVKNALRDRPFKGEFQGPQASVHFSVIRGMLLNAQEFIKFSKAPECMETPFSVACDVVDTADTLSLHLARDAPPEKTALHRLMKKLLRQAKSLELRLSQMSMVTSIMHSAIPSPWKEHKLISGKVWFSQNHTEDGNQWRKSNLREACKILSTALNAGPTLVHYKEAEPHLLHAAWSTVRIAAAAARTWFEYEAASNASTYWNSRSSNPPLRDPLQDVKAGSSTRRDDSPRAGLYPNLHGPPNQAPERGPSAPVAPLDPPMDHLLPLKRPCPAPQWSQPLSTNTAKLLAMMTLTIMLATQAQAAPFTSTANLTPGQYTEDMEIEGMFAYNNFIYVHKGTRLVNPNVKQAYRRVETKQLTQVPMLMSTLVGAMDRVCGIAAGKYGVGNFVTFFRSTRTSLRAAEGDCASHEGTIGIANSYHTVQRMQYYLLNMAPREALAPITEHDANLTLSYPDGQRADLSLFGGLFNENGGRWKGDLDPKAKYRFTYKIHMSKTLLVARECNEEDPTCGVPGDIQYTCSNQKTSPSSYTACNTGITMMIEHTKEMQKVVKSLFPKLPAEGKASQATRQILEAARNFSSQSQRSTSSMATEWAKLTYVQLIQDNLNIQNTTQSPAVHKAKRAIGFLVAGILGAITVAQVATTATQIQGASHSANLGVSIKALNSATRRQEQRLEQVEEDTRALARFITDIYNQQVLDHEQAWFEKTALEIELRFSDLVQMAHTAINRLGVLQLAKGQNQVLPSMLSKEELQAAATDALENQAIHLTTDLEEVQFDLIANGTDLFTVYRIPIVDEDRRLSLFEITPVPSFTDDGYRVMPVNPVPRAGFQRGGRGWVPMTSSEFQRCTYHKHSCRVATPIRPESEGACGISNYYERKEDGCTYVQTKVTQDFFHTSGNFTCFSVKKRTMLHMKCRDIQNNNHGIPLNRGSMAISQAGCFTFNDQCKIRAEDGQIILPSSILAVPLRLAPGSLVTTGNGPRATLITSRINVLDKSGVVSAIKAIITRAPTSPLQLIDFENTRGFTWSTFVIALLLIVISVMICRLRIASATNKRMLDDRWKDMQQQQKIMRERMRRAGALITPSMQSLASSVSKMLPAKKEAPCAETVSLRGGFRHGGTIVPATRSMQSLSSSRTIYQ